MGKSRIINMKPGGKYSNHSVLRTNSRKQQ